MTSDERRELASEIADAARRVYIIDNRIAACLMTLADCVQAGESAITKFAIEVRRLNEEFLADAKREMAKIAENN